MDILSKLDQLELEWSASGHLDQPLFQITAWPLLGRIRTKTGSKADSQSNLLQIPFSKFEIDPSTSTASVWSLSEWKVRAHVFLQLPNTWRADQCSKLQPNPTSAKPSQANPSLFYLEKQQKTINLLTGRVAGWLVSSSIRDHPGPARPGSNKQENSHNIAARMLVILNKVGLILRLLRPNWEATRLGRYIPRLHSTPLHSMSSPSLRLASASSFNSHRLWPSLPLLRLLLHHLHRLVHL